MPFWAQMGLAGTSLFRRIQDFDSIVLGPSLRELSLACVTAQYSQLLAEGFCLWILLVLGTLEGLEVPLISEVSSPKAQVPSSKSQVPSPKSYDQMDSSQPRCQCARPQRPTAALFGSQTGYQSLTKLNWNLSYVIYHVNCSAWTVPALPEQKPS